MRESLTETILRRSLPAEFIDVEDVEAVDMQKERLAFPHKNSGNELPLRAECDDGMTYSEVEVDPLRGRGEERLGCQLLARW